MKVIVNKKEIEIEDNCSVCRLLDIIPIEKNGSFAVAVGTKVINRKLWQETFLKEGDNITIIGATCGG